jgi:deoxyribonuclease-4
VLIGAHVRGGGPPVNALDRGREIGADAIQVFTQSPRAWRPTRYTEEALADFRAAAAIHDTVRATYCHATYLINLGTSDDTNFQRSVECLTTNLSVARGLGARGLVLHVGSHKGAGIASIVAQVASALRKALDEAAPGKDDPKRCPILLENAAGSGGTVGRTFEELEAVIAATDGDERLGICVDTQHLWASGVDYSSPEGADAVVEEIQRRFGIDRLGCMHLNDSKVPLGANRDRHENLGSGTVGEEGLASLLGHPLIQGTAALLEVPGDGKGPRDSDVEAARRVLARGLAVWSGTTVSTSKAAAKKVAPTPATTKKATTKKATTKKATTKKATTKKATTKKAGTTSKTTKKAAPKQPVANATPGKKATGASRAPARSPRTAGRTKKGST